MITEEHVLELFDLRHLTIQQQNVIDMLVTGCSDREAAEKVGINRSTVTRWRLYHPAFQAELNTQRAAVWGVAKEKLRALIPEAVDVVAEAIKDSTNPDRAKLALDLLRSVKVPDGLNMIDGRTDSGAILEAEAYESPYSSLTKPTDYQIIRHTDRLQARLNGLSDNEYDKAIEDINKREFAEKRAARKASKSGERNERLMALDLTVEASTPSEIKGTKGSTSHSSD